MIETVNMCPECEREINWFYLNYLDAYVGYCFCLNTIWSAKEEPLLESTKRVPQTIELDDGYEEEPTLITDYWEKPLAPACPSCGGGDEENALTAYIVAEGADWVLGWSCVTCGCVWEDEDIEWPFIDDWATDVDLENAGFSILTI